LLNLFRTKEKHLLCPDRKFRNQLKRILGFNPGHYDLYQLALIHKSASGKYSRNHDIHNERLEFLGDAILDSIVAEEIYKEFPDRDEGFLTQMRSKIVNRDILKKIAYKMGIGEIIITRVSRDNHKALFGNALEALIGAIYLDKGYKKTRKLILRKILADHVDLKKLSLTEVDFKSRIIEWGQKFKKDVNFTCKEQMNGGIKEPLFVSHLFVFDEIVGMGMGKSKKEAEQNAARQAIHSIGIQ
jgi:ribonuclease III